MPVGADAAEEEVDAAGLTDHLLIVPAFCLQVFGIAVQDMDVFLRAVDVVEEVFGHEGMVALRMALGQADILVHVERDDVLEADSAFLAGHHQFGIHPFRRRTGRQSEHERLFLVPGSIDALDDVVGRPPGQLFVVGFYD